MAQDRGSGGIRRAGRGDRDRGRQGRSHPRTGRAWLPAGVARRHPPRPQSRRVQGPDTRDQGDRAEPQPQQRRALPPRGARGGSQGGARGDPRPPAAGNGRRGQDLQHRRLRRLRRPRGDRRPDPHLRAFVEPRQPPVRGAVGGGDGPRQGPRYRPRAPADLAWPQADAGGSLAAGARRVQAWRRATGQGHEGCRLRRIRRDRARGGGPCAHFRARGAPRRDPERGRLPGRRGLGEDPRDRREPPPYLALYQARGVTEPATPRPDAARADRRGDPGRRTRGRAGPGCLRGSLPRGAARGRGPGRRRCRVRRGRAEGVIRIPPSFVGLTGGIAAGKSEALAAFGRLGAATLSSDAVVHDLLDDLEVRHRLVERWGGDVAPQGTVDRGRVGAIVFGSPEELAWLESTLHPLVGKHVAEWRAGLAPDVRLAVVEVPLLFESAMESAFDATVAVVANDETRASRAGLRGTDLLEARSDRQLPQSEKAARADHVITNDGSPEDLEGQVAELVTLLTGPSDSTS